MTSVSSSQSDLDSKAGQLLDDICNAVKDLGLIDRICKNYAQACQGTPISVRTLASEDRGRLFFEFLCFTAFNAYAVAPLSLIHI